jgi:hypothetical protein
VINTPTHTGYSDFARSILPNTQPIVSADQQSTLEVVNKMDRCDECEINQISHYCQNCDAYYCADCNHSAHHLKMLRAHTRFPCTVRSCYVTSRKCSLHQFDILNSNCLTCGVLICSSCMLDKHLNHKFELISTCASTLRDKSMPSLIGWNEYLTSFYEKHGGQRNLDIAFEASLSNIKSYFSVIREAVDDREAALIAELESSRVFSSSAFGDSVKHPLVDLLQLSEEIRTGQLNDFEICMCKDKVSAMRYLPSRFDLKYPQLCLFLDGEQKIKKLLLESCCTHRDNPPNKVTLDPCLGGFLVICEGVTPDVSYCLQFIVGGRSCASHILKATSSTLHYYVSDPMYWGETLFAVVYSVDERGYQQSSSKLSLAIGVSTTHNNLDCPFTRTPAAKAPKDLMNKGILYTIGTACGKLPTYIRPTDIGVTIMSSSSRSKDASLVIDNENRSPSFYFQDASLEIDIGIGRAIIPNAYNMNIATKDGINWKIEGKCATSEADSNWVPLAQGNATGDKNLLGIPINTSGAFRFHRVSFTSSRGYSQIGASTKIGGFEIFGSLLFGPTDTLKRSTPTFGTSGGLGATSARGFGFGTMKPAATAPSNNMKFEFGFAPSGAAPIIASFGGNINTGGLKLPGKAAGVGTTRGFGAAAGGKGRGLCQSSG